MNYSVPKNVEKFSAHFPMSGFFYCIILFVQPRGKNTNTVRHDKKITANPSIWLARTSKYFSFFKKTKKPKMIYYHYSLQLTFYGLIEQSNDNGCSNVECSKKNPKKQTHTPDEYSLYSSSNKMSLIDIFELHWIRASVSDCWQNGLHE